MPEHYTGGADSEQKAKMPAVVYGTNERTHGEDHEGLDRANPGDVGGGGAEELARFVVRLEVAEGVQNAYTYFKVY